MADAKTVNVLETLDLSGCKQIHGLANLSKCQNLTYINCTGSSITTESMKKFIEASKSKLKLTGSVISKKATKNQK